MRAVAGDDLRALARGLAAVESEADPAALWSVGKRGLNARGARKAALSAAALLDRPGEASLDGIGGLVEFVAVKAETGLEPQRIARAEADHRDLGLAQQPARESLGLAGGQRNLKTVLAGVAGARDEGVHAAQMNLRALMNGIDVEFVAYSSHAQRRRGGRPLQRQQRAVVDRRER